MGFFFKKSLYDDKPWRHGLPTAKGLKVTDDKDFDQERDVLLGLVKDFHKDIMSEGLVPQFSFMS